MEIDGDLRFPTGFDPDEVPGLRAELRQRLREAEPETLGDAADLPGMTPAALEVLARHVQAGCAGIDGDEPR